MSRTLFSAMVLGAMVSVTGAWAGEAGYLLNGKKIPVYQDGKKVGEYPGEEVPALKAEATKSRKPSSMFPGYDTLRYQEDNQAICYYFLKEGVSTAPSCVKK